VRGLCLLVLQLGGTGVLVAGMWFMFAPLVPFIRGWENWKDAHLEFSSGDQGKLERQGVRKRQLRAIAVMVLGAALHGVAVILRRIWFH